MDSLRPFFDERRSEIESYLQLLDAISVQAQDGAPRLGSAGPAITTEQQKILYATVYIQLYNLVEATVTRCLESVREAATVGGEWYPSDLSNELRREWVRTMAGTHRQLNEENRLKKALDLFEELVPEKPFAAWSLDRGGGGNWDDTEIEGVSKRLGLTLLSRAARQAAKQPVRNERGTMKLIKDLRNDLAHGSTSFVECGANVTVSELRLTADRAVKYLGEVVDAFSAAIGAYEFLRPASRPKSPVTT